MNPLVSVIIPTYNRPALLQRALGSVLSQSYSNLEVLVVDDSSNDLTERGFPVSDTRVRYLRNPGNKGANYSRNRGLSLAGGELVAFLDDDDEWLPTKLEKQLQVFTARPEVVLVYTGTVIVHDQWGLEYRNMPRREGALAQEILVSNYIGSTSTVMLRRVTALAVGGFDETLPALQDYDLWVRVCQIAEIGCVREPLVRYHYNQSAGQISGEVSRREPAQLAVNAKYSDLIAALPSPMALKRRVNGLLSRATHAHQFGSKRDARRLLLQAWSQQPRLSLILRILLTFLPYEFSVRLRGIAKAGQ